MCFERDAKVDEWVHICMHYVVFIKSESKLRKIFIIWKINFFFFHWWYSGIYVSHFWVNTSKITAPLVYLAAFCTRSQRCSRQSRRCRELRGWFENRSLNTSINGGTEADVCEPFTRLMTEQLDEWSIVDADISCSWNPVFNSARITYGQARDVDGEPISNFCLDIHSLRKIQILYTEQVPADSNVRIDTWKT